MDSSAPARCVDLRASQAVRLFAGAFTVAEGGPPDTRFGVNAPYVLLAQTDRPNADFLVLPTVHGGLSKQDPTGAFAVHGNTVDVRDRVASAPMAISCCRAGCCAPWTAKATAASAWPPTVTCASCAAPWPMA